MRLRLRWRGTSDGFEHGRRCGGAPLGIVGNSAGTGTLETGMYDEEEDTGERRAYSTGEYAAMIEHFAKGVTYSPSQQASLLANEYLAATQADYDCIDWFAAEGIGDEDRELLKEMIDRDGLGITLPEAERAVIELCQSRVGD